MVKELIREVFTRTNCPVTSFQLFHCDGQWRMPGEIIDWNAPSLQRTLPALPKDLPHGLVVSPQDV